jgi:hypothetical protein
MGAYGGTEEASRTPAGWGLLGDLTNDGIVDFTDYAAFLRWEIPGGSEQPWDLNRDGERDWLDLKLAADGWLDER